MSWLFLALTRLMIWIGDQIPVNWGLSQALGTIISLVLVAGDDHGTLLTIGRPQVVRPDAGSRRTQPRAPAIRD